MTTDDVRALVQDLRDGAMFHSWQRPHIAKTTTQWRAADALESLLARADAAEAECARLRLQLQIINDPDDEPSAGDYGCTR